MAGAKAKRSLKELIWGPAAGLGTAARVVALVFVVSSIASMSFCQLGFWPIGVVDGKPVYLMLILAPLIMGAFMFGPITGALLGLFTGAVLYFHAQWLPLDYYEVYFMTTLNTFALYTFLGAMSGLLLSLVSRKMRPGAARTALIVLICVVLSFLASGLVMVNTYIEFGGAANLEAIRTYLFNSPLGVFLQAAIDAILIVVLCLVADAVVRRTKTRGDDRTLLSVFRNWLTVIAVIVFMVSSAIIFSSTTLKAQEAAAEDMKSDAEYVAKQLDASGGSNVDTVLDGYLPSLDGYVAITDKNGIIRASDDSERFPKGASVLKAIGYEDVLKTTSADEFLQNLAADHDVQILQAANKDGSISMDVAFASFETYSDGFVVVMRLPDMVYADRFDAMSSSALLALALIVAVSILATILLNQVVVRRVDETNESLEKITAGNLNERVDVRNSREFKSLSAGINTTVAALRDTIDEVKQRNAQELTTAKAIQENSLPTEFPAFPDIDRFDIYASMKTAKEVGGDFYDFFLVDGTSKLGFIMADVSGKGIPAALFMMTAKTQIRNHMEAGLPLGEAVFAANHQLCIGNDAGMFVTAWIAELDYETGALEYVNAGHNPPMLLHDGAWEWLKDVSGMPLGLFDGIPYDSFTRQLEPIDMVYTYTDGVTEAMNPEGILFGEERLEETLRKYVEFNPRSVCVGVRRALTDFVQNAEQSDDITMLGLKYGVPPEVKAVMILDARTDQLVHVCNYIHAELGRRHAPKSVYNPLDIAAEELFVNVCHYAYPEATPENPGEARISFEYEPNPPSLTVQIVDDGIPYNPLAKPDAVTPDDIMEVPIGGLGILMAKNSVDEMTYERAGDSNVLTFRKGW